MARHARAAGGKVLRHMTFHQRAAMLKTLAQAVLARKEELYELSFATGATRSDSWIDIEGGAGTMLSFASKARAGKLSPADTRGGTFTISNHGVSGSLLASPIIIAQPQSAILGVGKLEKRVVVRTVGDVDTIQIRPMCYVSLTIDHRVLDGHQTTLRLSRFVATLEEWPVEC